MKKIDLKKVETAKQFINVSGWHKVEISEVKEIKNDGVRIMFFSEERDEIHQTKFWLTDDGLPFYKRFVEEAGFDIKKAENPLYLVGEKLQIKTIFVDEEKGLTKVVEFKTAK